MDEQELSRFMCLLCSEVKAIAIWNRILCFVKLKLSNTGTLSHETWNSMNVVLYQVTERSYLILRVSPLYNQPISERRNINGAWSYTRNQSMWPIRHGQVFVVYTFGPILVEKAN
jgi:hypothetical protein